MNVHRQYIAAFLCVLLHRLLNLIKYSEIKEVNATPCPLSLLHSLGEYLTNHYLNITVKKTNKQKHVKNCSGLPEDSFLSFFIDLNTFSFHGLFKTCQPKTEKRQESNHCNSGQRRQNYIYRVVGVPGHSEGLSS